MKEEIARINKMIVESFTEESKKVGELVFSNLLPGVPEVYLPESIFKNYFLPRFAGTIESPDPSWVTEWIGIAGSPVAEVAIVKDGTKEILFVVPGFICTDGLKTKKGEEELKDTFIRYGQISSNIPRNGTTFLFTSLEKRNKEMLQGLDLSERDKKWEIIKQRYGMSDVSEEEVEEEGNTDMFIFD